MQETQETWVRSLGQEDSLEEEMGTHSSILVWKIPRTEEPGQATVQDLQRDRIEHLHFPGVLGSIEILMFIFYLCIFFGEVFLKVFALYFSWVIHLLIVCL